MGRTTMDSQRLDICRYYSTTYPGTKISCFCILKDNGGSCEAICGGRSDRDERDEEEGEGGLQRGQDCRRQEAGQIFLWRRLFIRTVQTGLLSPRSRSESSCDAVSLFGSFRNGIFSWNIFATNESLNSQWCLLQKLSFLAQKNLEYKYSESNCWKT